MQVQLLNANSGDSSKQADVTDMLFNKPYNEQVVHQVVKSYMAGGRQGSKANKSRSEVRGGGAKPWRQKGTGRARAGTIRSPIFRGGGVTFAAKPRNYQQKVNKKVYRAAFLSIISKLYSENRLFIAESFELETHKTKELSEKLKKCALNDVLIVTSGQEYDDKLYLSSRNLKNVGACNIASVDPVSLIVFDQVVMTLGAIKELEGRYL